MLNRRLNKSNLERQLVARDLLAITQRHGDRMIAGLVRNQVRLLGEHIIDRRLLQRMRECLHPIERAGVQALAAKY